MSRLSDFRVTLEIFPLVALADSVTILPRLCQIGPCALLFYGRGDMANLWNLYCVFGIAMT